MEKICSYCHVKTFVCADDNEPKRHGIEDVELPEMEENDESHTGQREKDNSYPCSTIS